MKLLLDTHAFVWALRRPERLPESLVAIIRNRAYDLVVSAITPFELATKHRIGKLPEVAPMLLAYPDFLERLGARELPITSHHALVAGQLEWDHRDPFDRLLAAQSITESMLLVTSDAVFRSIGGVRTLWE